MLVRLHEDLGARRPALFGSVFSVFIHAALAFLLAVIFFEGPGGGGAGVSPEREVIISTEVDLTAGSMGDSGPSSAVTGAADEGLTLDASLPSADDALPSLQVGELERLGGASHGGGAGGEGAGAGDAGDGLGAGGGSARFFGVEARGSRFAYIVDTSGSMQGDRLAALQDELMRSVSELRASASFCIILFNSAPVPLTGLEWLPADEKARREAIVSIRGITAGGGTDPLPAFELVLQLKPKPDGIYFMTDGVFEAGRAEQLVALIDRVNRKGGKRTQLHCITFIERESEKLMRRLARLSGGTYTHIEGPRKP